MMVLAANGLGISNSIVIESPNYEVEIVTAGEY
jgi:hypothetical protein